MILSWCRNIIAGWCFVISCVSKAEPCELTVSAASSLSRAFKEIATHFEHSHQCRVRLNFAASGMLVQQMSHGAPADVLATADQQSMDRAAQLRLIDVASRQDFIANSLVLIAPAHSVITYAEQGGLKGPPAIVALNALTDQAIQYIAIGNPSSVPAGRYARESLQQAGLWQVLSPRIVMAINVRQVLDYVIRGEVEAGFVYASDAQGQPVKLISAIEVNTPITYPIAVSDKSANAAVAHQFKSFVLSHTAQQILQQHGFSSGR